MTQSELTRAIKELKAAPAGTRRKTTASQSADFSQGDSGTISGYFSIFAHKVRAGTYEGKVDSYGDIVAPGAFEGTLKRRRATGKPWPLLYNHDFDQIIGRVTDIHTDDYGAFFTAEFFPTERAQEIRACCKAGVLYQFSWAYDTLKQERVKLTDGTQANCLREVELYEITITGIPAEPRAQMTDIKGNANELKKVYKLMTAQQNPEARAEAKAASEGYALMVERLKNEEALEKHSYSLERQIIKNLEYMAKFQRNPEKAQTLEKAHALKMKIPAERLKWFEKQAKRADSDISAMIAKGEPGAKIEARERALAALRRKIAEIKKEYPWLK